MVLRSQFFSIAYTHSKTLEREKFSPNPKTKSKTTGRPPNHHPSIQVHRQDDEKEQDNDDDNEAGTARNSEDAAVDLAEITGKKDS